MSIKGARAGEGPCENCPVQSSGLLIQKRRDKLDKPKGKWNGTTTSKAECWADLEEYG